VDHVDKAEQRLQAESGLIVT